MLTLGAVTYVMVSTPGPVVQKLTSHYQVDIIMIPLYLDNNPVDTWWKPDEQLTNILD